MLVPIEATVVPAGWAWEMPSSASRWISRLDRGGDDHGRGGRRLGQPDAGLFANASLAMSRSAEVQVALLGAESIELQPIGDGSFAWREADGGVAIQWLHGDMLGTITSSDEDSVDALTQLALALDAVIP